MRIMFVTRELNGVMGGLERQLSLIGNSLANRGHKILIASLENNFGRPFFPLENKNIDFYQIVAGNPRINAAWQTRFLRQKILWRGVQKFKPDVVVCFMIGAFIFAKPVCAFLKIPVILAERNSPDIYRLTRAKKIRWVLLFVAFFAKKIVVQFPKYRMKYPFYLQKKIEAIPNEVPRMSFFRKNSNDILTFGFAGRYSFQKRVDELIVGFVRFNNKFPNTRLLLFGNGEREFELRKLVMDLKAEEFIIFHKEDRNIENIFSRIDIFCLFSIWEGFPNVLAEALSSGIPCIGFSNCDGVDDLIVDHSNGWKIPFEESQISALKLLEKSYFGYKAGEVTSFQCVESISQYGSEIIYDKWEDLLSSIAKTG